MKTNVHSQIKRNTEIIDFLTSECQLESNIMSSEGMKKGARLIDGVLNQNIVNMHTIPDIRSNDQMSLNYLVNYLKEICNIED